MIIDKLCWQTKRMCYAELGPALYSTIRDHDIAFIKARGLSNFELLLKQELQPDSAIFTEVYESYFTRETRYA